MWEETKERFRYRFENFMTKGGSSIFISLTVVFLICFFLAVLVRVFLVFLSPSNDLNQSLEMIWTVFLEMTDPGSMTEDSDSSALMKLSAILSGMVGVVIFSMLIAFITTQLDAVLDQLKKGQSKVLESGQTLILGWNDRVLDIIRELVIANESESDATIVILAEKDKVEMDDIIATGIEELKTTRVITRRGSGATLSNLRRVAAKEAKSAILLSRAKESDNEEERRSADARVLKTILALISCQGGHNSMSIVVDIHYQSNRELLKTFEDPLITAIDNWDILAKILVQTSRTTGLAMVYDEILSFRGCELYFYKANWKNLPFCELAFHFQDGVPIGVRKADGTLILKPGQESVMEPEDEVLLIAEDDSSIHFAESPVVRPEELPFTLQRREKQVERELILGWHIMTKNIIREYTDYLMEGSTVDIMVPNPSEELIREIVELQEENTTLTINPIDLNPMSITQLKQVDPFSYDNIIVLSQTTRGASAERVDSETLFILLLLRKVHKELERPGESQTTIITQVLNSENQELITQTEVDDFLISNKIVTMIYAQLSEEAGMRQVYEDIFAEEGSEIYVKPVTLYFPQLPVKARFADLIALACKRDEICIGIRLGEHAHHPDKNFGITLNPAKDAVFTLDDDDSLVVLAEDEL